MNPESAVHDLLQRPPAKLDGVSIHCGRGPSGMIEDLANCIEHLIAYDPEAHTLSTAQVAEARAYAAWLRLRFGAVWEAMQDERWKDPNAPAWDRGDDWAMPRDGAER